MKKRLLVFFLITSFGFSQTQIGSDIDGENLNDRFGTSVSLSSNGDIIAIGGIFNNGNGSSSGHVRILQNNSGVWEQIGDDIDGTRNGSQSGNSVSLSSDGTIVAFGGPFYDIFDPNTGTSSQDHGSVAVYRNNSGTWEQIGSDIIGDVNNDRLGISTSISSDGSIVAIGSNDSSSNGTRSGQVKVFENVSDSWVQKGSNINGIEAYSNTGVSVSLSSNGETLAVGSSYDDTDATSTLGSVHVYSFESNSWVQKGNTINGLNNNEYIGNPVRISSDGSILAIGSRIAPWNPDPNVGENGLVRVYKFNSNTWSQVGIDIEGSAKSQELGASISLSSDGSKLAVGSSGSPFYAGSNQEGFVQVFELSAILSAENIEIAQLNIFPNPALDEFTIQLKENIQLEKISIYNQLGQLVKVSTTETTIISGLSSGMYFVEIATDQGTSTQKLIIE